MRKLLISLLLNGILVSGLYAQELEPIKLQEPQLDRGASLMKALQNRQTIRSFSDEELSFDLLSNLLWSACGVNRPDMQKFTAPSAKNWQEIDIYVALKQGLYLYNKKEHRLDPVMPGDIREHTGIQEFTQIAPVNLIYVANYDLMDGDASDKDLYSAIDTGYISQNVYLFCASEGLATVALGWVDKPELAEIMKLGDNQKIILTQPVGYIKK
ncbi:MAG: SagB/ThcOx family dehydrogenase [Candidatus Auribacter fodinae]|jgi:SagB-type dehydrogenase family enzyme|uniref:SagB/ThcOx family dehydrogenase n=1 Tax=Candidatus Auribacter fodinae TaxID=2093366 RepID=A0A3A4R332_9BACT|nr:MAG: SagB/ThcOx family dehydrogenase [Candidatus Auribacter fodinae]